MISSFPRSANTYLRYLLWASYCPNEQKVLAWHTERKIAESNEIFVSFRNPADAIASLTLMSPIQKNILENNEVGTGFIKYYVRINRAALNNLHKAIILDFDKFIYDHEYIYSKVKDKIGLDPMQKLSNEDIIKIMKDNNKQLYLPLNNEEIKKERIRFLLDNYDLTEANEVYWELKNS